MDSPQIIWLESELCSFAAQSESGIVAIDGATNAGKSHVARNLSSSLRWPLVSCDRFVQHGERFYPDILNIAALQEELNAALASGTPVLLEGVMLQMVLRKLAKVASLNVYVRGRDAALEPSWPELFDGSDPKELLDQLTAICRIGGTGDDEPDLDRELVSYHATFKPHLSAHVVFENVIPDGS